MRVNGNFSILLFHTRGSDLLAYFNLEFFFLIFTTHLDLSVVYRLHWSNLLRKWLHSGFFVYFWARGSRERSLSFQFVHLSQKNLNYFRFILVLGLSFSWIQVILVLELSPHQKSTPQGTFCCLQKVYLLLNFPSNATIMLR